MSVLSSMLLVGASPVRSTPTSYGPLVVVGGLSPRCYPGPCLFAPLSSFHCHLNISLELHSHPNYSRSCVLRLFVSTDSLLSHNSSANFRRRLEPWCGVSSHHVSYSIFLHQCWDWVHAVSTPGCVSLVASLSRLLLPFSSIAVSHAEQNMFAQHLASPA